jgi:hypothetical protein
MPRAFSPVCDDAHYIGILHEILHELRYLSAERIVDRQDNPFEQFPGMKLDAKRDLRVAFGDYVLATLVNTDNSMRPRAEPCIALGGLAQSHRKRDDAQPTNEQDHQEIRSSFSQCQI